MSCLQGKAFEAKCCRLAFAYRANQVALPVQEVRTVVDLSPAEKGVRGRGSRAQGVMKPPHSSSGPILKTGPAWRLEASQKRLWGNPALPECLDFLLFTRNLPGKGMKAT
ncbi:MAG: hypothetical protein FJ271_25270 [Planctomycetes bacterium]|nr:hypothetical protein [Planctomycetota bacterium]